MMCKLLFIILKNSLLDFNFMFHSIWIILCPIISVNILIQLHFSVQN